MRLFALSLEAEMNKTNERFSRREYREIAEWLEAEFSGWRRERLIGTNIVYVRDMIYAPEFSSVAEVVTGFCVNIEYEGCLVYVNMYVREMEMLIRRRYGFGLQMRFDMKFVMGDGVDAIRMYQECVDMCMGSSK
jgi:hypothetical protein